MRIGGDTRRRVQGIKEEMEEPLRQLVLAEKSAKILRLAALHNI